MEHTTVHTISHAAVFVLRDLDTFNSHPSKGWSVARLFTVLNSDPRVLSGRKSLDSSTRNEQHRFQQCLKDPVSTYSEMKRQKNEGKTTKTQLAA